MFTGLIECVGEIKNITEKENGKEFLISPQIQNYKLNTGESIAVNGACQTVETSQNNEFTVFSVPETLKVTNLNNLKVTNQVNLERPLSVNDRLGGHIVQGHVEGLSEITNIEKHPGFWDIVIKYESEFLVPKGSVTIDGISLTIHEIIKNDEFRVQIIPETVKRTNIGQWDKGYLANIETDYIIKAMDHIQNYRKNL